MTRNTNPVSNKPHLRLRPWPEHDVMYLERGWCVYKGESSFADFLAATRWSVHWNYAHRQMPRPGSRAHERFG